MNQYKESTIEEIVLIGFEIQNLTPHLQGKRADKFQASSLKHLSQTVSNLSVDKIVKNYRFDYQSAEAVLPALEINYAIAEALGVKTVLIPISDYERGLLTDLSSYQGHAQSFEHEVIQSAIQLAEKFQVDAEHAQQVCKLAEQLFEHLAEIHHLDNYDLLLLRASAILHEAGGFISSKSHHKHSMYLIMHSEIFGLGQEDVNLIALISRYHRNSPPKPNHPIYKDLSVKDQIRVTKISAILRVADALDRTHSGRIGEVDISIKKRKLFLTIHGVQDASVERLAMRSKGDLLQDIFGIEIIINELIK